MRKAGQARIVAPPPELFDVLESMTDGLIAFDRDWRITYVNAAAERASGMARDRLLGKEHWEAFPAMLGTDFERELRRAMTERVPIRSES
ncbi:MAG TPA: PAS domain-containing protein, partial [Kofleriaceae bacterium]|nr:PAS domain-containing protein [Kofleriaceae bacterium]